MGINEIGTAMMAITFELDTMESNERALRRYKEALQQWKEGHTNLRSKGAFP